MLQTYFAEKKQNGENKSQPESSAKDSFQVGDLGDFEEFDANDGELTF